MRRSLKSLLPPAALLGLLLAACGHVEPVTPFSDHEHHDPEYATVTGSHIPRRVLEKKPNAKTQVVTRDDLLQDPAILQNATQNVPKQPQQQPH